MTRDRRRERDGAGKSERSHVKHELVEHVAAAQAAVLSWQRKGRGLIVDMHAGDGEGVESPQLSLFGPGVSRASARLAALLALRHGADLILCEKRRDRRAALEPLRHQVPGTRIVDDNLRLLELVERHAYPWLLLLNDPNGHSGHCLDVIYHLPRRIPRSDVVVVLNEGSLHRHLALRPTADDTSANAALVRASRRAAEGYRWMIDPLQWAVMAGKRVALRSVRVSASSGFKGRVMLLTNYPARVDRRLFERLTLPREARAG